MQKYIFDFSINLDSNLCYLKQTFALQKLRPVILLYLISVYVNVVQLISNYIYFNNSQSTFLLQNLVFGALHSLKGNVSRLERKFSTLINKKFKPKIVIS